LRIADFVVGPLSTNCYLVWCEETLKGLVIDPGFTTVKEMKTFLKEVRNYGVDIDIIVNTHGHPDHVSGNAILRDATGAPVLIHRLDIPLLRNAPKIAPLFGLRMKRCMADGTLKEGDVIRFGNEKLEVLHTPGHTQGSICILGEGVIFTGDTLFCGSIGRVDFPESSESDMMRSLRRLMELPDETAVYPGHGPSTTIGAERATNPYVAMALEGG